MTPFCDFFTINDKSGKLLLSLFIIAVGSFFIFFCWESEIYSIPHSKCSFPNVLTWGWMGETDRSSFSLNNNNNNSNGTIKNITCCLNVCHKVLCQFSLVESIRTLFGYFPISCCKLGKYDGVIFFQDVTLFPTKHFTEIEGEKRLKMIMNIL